MARIELNEIVPASDKSLIIIVAGTTTVEVVLVEGSGVSVSVSVFGILPLYTISGVTRPQQ